VYTILMCGMSMNRLHVRGREEEYSQAYNGIMGILFISFIGMQFHTLKQRHPRKIGDEWVKRE